MKKIALFVSLLLTIGIATVQAQSLVVTYKNAAVQTFAFSEIDHIGFTEISAEFEGYMVIHYTDNTQAEIAMADVDHVLTMAETNYPSESGTCYLYEVDSWINSGTVNEEIDKSLVAGNWWYQISENGIEINGAINYEVMDGYYGALGFYLCPDTITKYFDIANTEEMDITTTTLLLFYPLDANKEEAVGWSSYEPGEWYDADGNPATYSTGAAYWIYQIYETMADSYDFRDASGYMKGYMLLGQRPNNTTVEEDTVYTHYSKLNGKDWIVNISYYNVPEREDPGEQEDKAQGEGVTDDGHEYSWDISENGIFIECTINMDVLSGSWEMASFYMGNQVISELIGLPIDSIGQDLSYFYPVEPDGTEGTSWTSYIPGQWVDLTGAASDWSAGILYWQYQCVENYDGHTMLGEMVLGTNPTNVATVVDGTTVVTKAKLCGYDFVVTVNFRTTASMVSYGGESGSSLVWEMDSWLNNGTPDETIDKSLVSGTWSYDITGSGITINGRIDAQAMGDYNACIGFYLSPDTINKYFDVDVTATDISTFYPLDGSGAMLSEWSANAPGQWYDVNGDPGAWGEVPVFWYYQIYSTEWYDLTEDGSNFKYGYFVMGQTPNSEDIEEGVTYTQKSELNGKSWTVNIQFYNTIIEYEDPDTPTGSGTVGAHSYSWDISEEGIKIDCTIKVDSLDGSSWEMMSFILGRKQISELIDIDIAEVADDITLFYPVEPDGTQDSTWTSYVPGQWVDLTGAASNWSAGVLYWQYQCVKNYDSHTVLGEFVLGTNPSNTATAVGSTVVTKAKLLDYDFIVTVKFE